MRLDKFLSAYAGVSRKEARQLVREGHVLVDGKQERSENVKVTREQQITLDGEAVQGEESVYYMMNKPSGVISATRDERARTVLDLMPEVWRPVFPIGRLDKDTEGLLILSDDGALAHRLLSPAYHVEKTYEVRYEGDLRETVAEEFRQGIDIGERRKTKPAQLELLAPGRARLTISEGKFHQVKRMFAAAGGQVTGLRRVAMAGLLLDENLKPGEYRRLSEEEIEQLRQACRGR